MIKSFLNSNGLASDTGSIKSLATRLADDMEAAVAGDHASGLVMARSWIGERPSYSSGKAIAIDAGGTNLRAALLEFIDDGSVVVHERLNRHMPGVGSPLTIDQFLDVLHAFTAPLHPEHYPIGISLGYPMIAHPDGEVNVIGFCKEVNIAIPHHYPLVSSICNRYWPNRAPQNVRVINDTCGVLLAGRGRIGFILGTGINASTMVETPNGSDVFALEVERWMNFPRSRFDESFDSCSLAPGDSLFEKAISGAYLGRLFHHIVSEAINEGLFSSATEAAWGEIETVTTVALDRFLRNNDKRTADASEAPFLTPRDRASALEIAHRIEDRAARLSAAVILACGSDRWHRSAVDIPVSIEGSTWSKFHRLSTYCRHYVERNKKADQTFRFRLISDGSLLGAGRSALMSSGQYLGLQ